MIRWAIAFMITVACELPLVAICAPQGLRRRSAGDSVLVNMLTHPLAWLSVTSLGQSWLVVECTVLIVEAIVYATVTRMPWPRAVAAATLANVVTASLSFLL
jgi:hypothetical protein